MATSAGSSMTNDLIRSYLSSVPDSDQLFKVVINPIEREWLLRDIKTRFENQTGTSSKVETTTVHDRPIMCPCLPPLGCGQLGPPNAVLSQFKSAPPTSAEDKAEFAGILEREPYFEGRVMIGEKGASYTVEELEFDTWFVCKQGKVTVGNPLIDFKFEMKPDGCLQMVLKGKRLFMMFNERSILETGCVWPLEKQTEDKEDGKPEKDEGSKGGGFKKDSEFYRNIKSNCKTQ